MGSMKIQDLFSFVCFLDPSASDARLLCGAGLLFVGNKMETGMNFRGKGG